MFELTDKVAESLQAELLAGPETVTNLERTNDLNLPHQQERLQVGIPQIAVAAEQCANSTKKSSYLPNARPPVGIVKPCGHLCQQQ